MAAFDLESHAFFWMTQVIASRDRQLAVELKGNDLRVPEWRALASLHARKTLSMSELADLASIERSTLSRTVDRMQRSGWPEDRTEVTLTHLGNVIAASLPLTLHQAVSQGRANSGDTLLMVGTGAGLTAGGVIWKL